MPKIITFATLKGGAGKTMNLFNIAGTLAANGKKVLLIDVDPQCNLSSNCGIDASDTEMMTIHDVFSKYSLEEQPKADEVITKRPVAKLPKLDIIPSSINLFYIEDDLTLLEGRTKILQNFFKRNKSYLKKYDYILIDTNPSMSVFNINAFYAADSIVISTDISINSVRGVEIFCGLWDLKRSRINETADKPKADNIKAVIVGNCDGRSKLPKYLLDFLRTQDYSNEIVLESYIPATVQLKETELYNMPISVLHPKSDAARAYINVVDELTKKGVL